MPASPKRPARQSPGHPRLRLAPRLGVSVRSWQFRGHHTKSLTRQAERAMLKITAKLALVVAPDASVNSPRGTGLRADAGLTDQREGWRTGVVPRLQLDGERFRNRDLVVRAFPRSDPRTSSTSGDGCGLRGHERGRAHAA